MVNRALCTFSVLIVGAHNSRSVFPRNLMKTFWDSGFPNELIEASRLEGATEWQIFWRIGMPLKQTGLVTVTLFCFVGAWNNFFLPLIVLNQDSLYPLTLGLNVFEQMEIVVCADLNPAAAEARALEFGIRSCSVEALLEDRSVELVLNHHP